MEKKDLIIKTSALLGITEQQVEVVLNLLEEGATIPFIARYRKDMTQNLNEDQIQGVYNEFKYQKNLQERKESILEILRTKELLTDELEQLILSCEKLSELENIYKPYKEGKKTKASIAIKLGLKPLADWMLTLPKNGDLQAEAQKYITEEVKTIEDAIAKARDIIAEIVSNDQEIRDALKETITKFGRISSVLKPKAEDPKKTYENYYDFNSHISRMQAYKIMAINRGEKEKILNVKLEYKLDFAQKKAYYKYSKNYDSEIAQQVRAAIDDAFKRLIVPSIENSVRNDLTEIANTECISIFSKNLEQLLLQPPIKDKNILGWDPGFSAGCKLAVVLKNNTLKSIDLVNLNNPKYATDKIVKLVNEYDIDIIAIGNGTASRESEKLVAEIIKENNLKCEYCIVNEAGASVYSTSENGKKEFPDLEAVERSAISIARRVVDPLAELIKIPPLSIGVGQYQHDVPGKDLSENLDFVVSKVVNKVGVDLNTASAILLSNISGLNKKIAEKIVQYREKNKEFKTRNELLEIKEMTEQQFELASGFLRVIGQEPLDKTNIHPESYEIAYNLMKLVDLDVNDIGTSKAAEKLANINVEKEAKALNTDIYTLTDIINSLKSELRDYRDSFPQPMLRKDILNIENLSIGLVVQGVIRNITQFGAFVDIGIKEYGLLHKSKMNLKENQNITDILNINDIVDVKIIDLDVKTEKIKVELVNDKK